MALTVVHVWNRWEMVGGWKDGRESWVRVCADCGRSEYRELPPDDDMPSDADGAVHGKLLSAVEDASDTGQAHSA